MRLLRLTTRPRRIHPYSTLFTVAQLLQADNTFVILGMIIGHMDLAYNCDQRSTILLDGPAWPASEGPKCHQRTPPNNAPILMCDIQSIYKPPALLPHSQFLYDCDPCLFADLGKKNYQDVAIASSIPETHSARPLSIASVLRSSDRAFPFDRATPLPQALTPSPMD